MQAVDGLRQRRNVIKTFEKFDAFPKVPESYQETTTSGGTVSILVFIFITILVVSEFFYFANIVTSYSYEVDKDAEHKIRINVDMTVAMNCDDIGADVLDLSGSSIDISKNVFLENTYFAMSKEQKKWWESFRSVRHSSDGYQSLHDVRKMSNIYGALFATAMPKKDIKEFVNKDFDACRIYGNVEVNKVAGNFHITAGKSIPHPRGHAHLSSLVSELNYNFSHRIDMLSFGDPHPGIINPLDGDLETTDAAYHMYQYYIKIVPTNIHGLKFQMKANQYSVTQRARKIDHGSGSHGVPGIFFKYDLHPICVNVKESFRSFTQFLIRLCGIIGGVFATSGMMHSLIGFLADKIMCNFMNNKQSQDSTRNATQTAPTSVISNTANVQVPTVEQTLNNTPEVPNTTPMTLIPPTEFSS